jgi:hypothetical protein
MTELSSGFRAAQSLSEGSADEVQLRKLFADRGLCASPYTRLTVAVSLLQELDAHGPVGPNEVAASRVLAARAGCSSAQAKRGLRTLRKSGCLLDDRGRALLSHALPIGGCVSSDPLRLDELCVRALSRIADAQSPHVFEDGEARAAFIRIAGREPIEDGAEDLAIDEVRAHSSRRASERLPLGAVNGILSAAGLNPVTGAREVIIPRLVDLVRATSGDLTAGELAIEVEDGLPPGSGTSVMRALLQGRVVVSVDDRLASHLDDIVVSLAGDATTLEAACASVYRAEVERQRPELLESEAGVQAFDRVLTEPRPLSIRKMVEALRDADVDPEPRARTAIVKELSLLCDGEREWTIPQLLDAVAEILPVKRRQVRNIVNALQHGGLLVIAPGVDRRPRIRGLTYANVADLELALAAFYEREVVRMFPELEGDPAATARIRRAIGLAVPPSAPELLSPMEAAVRQFQGLQTKEDRRRLLEHARAVLASAPEAGLPPNDLRRALAAHGDYTSNRAGKHLLALAHAGLLRSPSEDVLLGLNREARVAALSTDDLEAADRAVVDACVDEVARRVPDVDRETIRSAFSLTEPPGQTETTT